MHLYIIADRKLKDQLIEELLNSGAALINFVYGHGYHESRNLFDVLGFSEERGKVIINCLIMREKTLAFMELLNEKYLFKTHNTGIAFTIPVEKIVY